MTIVAIVEFTKNYLTVLIFCSLFIFVFFFVFFYSFFFLFVCIAKNIFFALLLYIIIYLWLYIHCSDFIYIVWFFLCIYIMRTSYVYCAFLSFSIACDKFLMCFKQFLVQFTNHPNRDNFYKRYRTTTK